MEHAIKDRLRELRGQLKLSQKDMAESIGVKQSYYSDMENGRRSITGKFIEKLKKVHNVSTDWMYTGEGSPFTSKSNNESTPYSVPLVSLSAKGHEIQRVYSKEWLFLQNFYESLTNKEIDHILAREIEELRDLYVNYKKLCGALPILKAPNFIIKKFPKGEEFSKIKREIDEDVKEISADISDPKALKAFKISHYRNYKDYTQGLLYSLISYIHLYADFFNSDPPYEGD